MLPNFTGRSVLLFGVILIACSLSASSGAQQSRSEVQQHFLAAQKDQQAGQFDAAAQEYQMVLHLQPALPEAYVNLGLVYYAQAKFEESSRALAAAAKLRPGMHGISLWLGIDDVKLNRPAQGIGLLREAVREDPADKLAQSWLGTALWDAGQTNAALLQIRKGAAQFPDDPDFLFACGEAYGKAANQQTEQLLDESSGTALSDLIYGTHYAEERDWVKAEGHLRRAILRDPHSNDARLELVKVFIQQANLPAAEEQLTQAMKVAPQSAAAVALDGEVLLLMQHQAEGLSQIEKAMGTDPSEALAALGLPPENDILAEQVDAALLLLCREALHALDATSVPARGGETAKAALLALSGDTDTAHQAFQRIDIPRTHEDPPANLFARAATDLDLHRYDDAEVQLERWLAIHPNDLSARYSLVSARRSISMAQVSRLITLAPDSYHVHQLLGELYVSREEDDKALAEYLAVASARPDLPGVHFWVGHLYWKHGDADHAITELTRELKLSPGHPEAEAELGTVLVAEERAAEAIPHLQLAIRSKPDLWPAYAQLGRAYAIEKDYPRAEAMLKGALAHDHDATAHYQLALVLRAEGKAAQAAQAFAAVRAIKAEKMAVPSADDSALDAVPRGGTSQ
jgi:tetratricopeptide (TPR) repeat protein